MSQLAELAAPPQRCYPDFYKTLYCKEYELNKFFHFLKGSTSLLLVLGVWILVLQNFGVIPTSINVTVDSGKIYVNGSVDVDNTVDVRGEVDVENTVDINLDKVVGYQLITSERGMFIGVNSTENTVIPINWGSVSRY